MQRRFFWIFFPMMFIPALLAMMMDWHNNREQLAVLDGPGLTNSFEASLELARQVLDTEKETAQRQAHSLADQAADGILPLVKESVGEQTVSWWWAESQSSGEWQWRAGSSVALADSLLQETNINPAGLKNPTRRLWHGRSWIFATAEVNNESGVWIVVASPLPGNLDTLLEQVTQGSSGVRQLRFFYSRLLRSNLMVNLGILTVSLLVLSFILSHRLSRYLAHPLQELSLGTERVAAGDLTHRIKVNAPAELGVLVSAFNRMTDELLQGRENLRRAEQVAAWQGVARRLAHEIKNPLTPITLAMHRIGKKSDDEVILSCVGTVLEEAANLGRLADEFSLYAKLPAPQPTPMDTACLRELLESLGNFYLARTRVDFCWSGWDCPFLLSVDHGQVRQVLSNLIKNANEAMAGQGTLVFELEISEEPGQPIKSDHKGSWVHLKIKDSGPGFTDDPEHVFEPYVTTKPTGTGLGLAVARRIIEDNGGCLWAISSSEGATFMIDLPDVSLNAAQNLSVQERKPS